MRKAALMEDDKDRPRLGRRMLVLRIAGVGVAGSALAGCVMPPPGGAVYAPGPARTGYTDADPNDGPGFGRGGYRRGTGLTDADPNDGAGQGRGGYRGNRVYTGVNDSDPGDGAGYGRGGYRGRARTGYTDADPGDGAGYGRGGYRRQISDSDPRDAPGRGRGW
ncbi:hypothetical protein [Neoroseomonas soli]|uniref:Uncharacterized protein n=1 Tax=Neoroseomonas soli TaxID=1081025 RepID=A0A9X9WSV9_9PROT|nr:hypothetical protein [Neoroseomonas soli]MBR0670238.1 hypothetical protein [Neoroseomonas soli]